MKNLTVILDNIRSAHNVGAIFRTCDGAGVNMLYLCGITPYPPHKKILKTALGAEEYIKWKHENSTKNVIHELQGQGYKIISVEQTSKAKHYNNFSYPQKVALVFGNEITGISSEVLALSDHHIELPMIGRKNSLNVSTTVGIIVYHIIFSSKNEHTKTENTK